MTPNYHCPVCGTESTLIISEVQAFCTRNPKPPKQVMIAFADWMAQFDHPVLCCSPLMFDGFWIRYYFERFVGNGAFKLYHNAIDLRSFSLGATGRYSGDIKAWVEAVTGKKFANPWAHYAVADARIQGKYLFALMDWARENQGWKMEE